MYSFNKGTSMRNKTMKTDLKELANGYAMLSDLTRLGVLQALASGPKSTMQLRKTLNLKRTTLDHHLGLLRMSRLVIGACKGKEVIYEMDAAALKALGAEIARLGGK